ncbi:MAG: amidohydrolase family protein [Anaerolineae bacterium]|jgi:cytosine/adenosine deaminase-related metal-dependent hydrolase|nr:amidohydrolase family protein [Anaerolineae bacterium]MBT4459828.1 amidohydrolase family protein [Anaerolineae bacterium]MBT6060678.1 amidohydrolase family protein [Anaerolineae bacterium]MBT6321220.1 amidohydrolase family protein [Anaerolineae bacterium]MBT6814286.1 amidohydrolase family protein [Anaerolineae bacterium]
MNGTLILPQFLIQKSGQTPKEDWGVRVLGGRIDAVGSNQALREQYPEDKIVDAPNSVLSPGFVNAHVHLYGVLAHGIPLTNAPSDFWAFLDDFWWPLVENALDSKMIAAATDFGCAEMLRGGTTSFYDCLEAPFAIPDALLVQKEIVEKHGLRGTLSFEATERVSKENGQLGLQENTKFIDLCQKESGLVQGLMCFHTSFTCSEEFIRQAFSLGADRGVLTHMHCNEGVHEPEYALKHFGKRTLEYYDELGVTGAGMLASQCVQLSERERAIIAEKNIKVTHMPLSNCEVGGGIAPVPELVANGVTLGLGSDGYINDFFEVMRGAFLIHKANQLDPQVMPAKNIWYLATEGGARAMGLKNVGRLAPGWVADLQLIDAAFNTPTKAHNLYDQLVLWRNQHHVKNVMVNGKWRVRNGIVLDADLGAMRARVHESAERMWRKAQ